MADLSSFSEKKDAPAGDLAQAEAPTSLPTLPDHDELMNDVRAVLVGRHGSLSSEGADILVAVQDVCAAYAHVTGAALRSFARAEREVSRQTVAADNLRRELDARLDVGHNLERCSARVEELERQFEDQAKRHEAETERMEEATKAIEAEVTTLRSKNKDLEREQTRLQDCIGHLKDEAGELTVQIESLHHELTAERSSHNVAREKVDELEEEVERLKSSATLDSPDQYTVGRIDNTTSRHELDSTRNADLTSQSKVDGPKLIKSERCDHDATIARLRKMIERQQKELSEYTIALDSKRQEIALLKRSNR